MDKGNLIEGEVLENCEDSCEITAEEKNSAADIVSPGVVQENCEGSCDMAMEEKAADPGVVLENCEGYGQVIVEENSSAGGLRVVLRDEEDTTDVEEYPIIDGGDIKTTEVS